MSESNKRYYATHKAERHKKTAKYFKNFSPRKNHVVASLKYLKAHLDRGAKMIYSEFKYSKDFLLALLSDEKGI